MPHLSWGQRLIIALGGVLLLIGFVVLLFAILNVLGAQNLSVTVFLSKEALLTIGLLNILAGTVLLLKR